MPIQMDPEFLFTLALKVMLKTYWPNFYFKQAHNHTLMNYHLINHNFMGFYTLIPLGDKHNIVKKTIDISIYSYKYKYIVRKIYLKEFILKCRDHITIDNIRNWKQIPKGSKILFK